MYQKFKIFPIFQENREKLLQAVRKDDLEGVKAILSGSDAAKLARAKNYYGNTSIDAILIAILFESTLRSPLVGEFQLKTFDNRRLKLINYLLLILSTFQADAVCTSLFSTNTKTSSTTSQAISVKL